MSEPLAWVTFVCVVVVPQLAGLLIVALYQIGKLRKRVDKLEQG